MNAEGVRHFRTRCPLFYAALIFAAGGAGGSLYPLPLSYLGGVFIFLFLGWWRAPGFVPQVCFVAMLFLGGWWHGQSPQFWHHPQDVRFLPSSAQTLNRSWQGTVISAPEIRGNAQHCFLALNQGVRGQVALVLSDVSDLAKLSYGQQIELIGSLVLPPEPKVPGQFNYRDYLLARGIDYQLKGDFSSLRVLQEPAAWDLQALAFVVRDWARVQLTVGLEDHPEISAILTGMLLGYRADLSPEVESAFRTTGTFHIFSVSGQNLAVLLAIGVMGLRLFGRQRWRWGWLCAPLLFFYCLVSGCQPSIVRALIMALLLLFLWWWRRPLVGLNLWATALLLVLAVEPRAIRDLGFHLSFSVVLALILFSAPWARWLSQPTQLDPLIIPRFASRWARWQAVVGRGTAYLLGASLAAWCGSLPWSLFCFHQISLVGVLANLWVVPIAGLVVVVGTFSLFFAPWFSVLTSVGNLLNAFLVKMMLAGVTTAAAVPWATVYVADVSVWKESPEPRFIIVSLNDSQSIYLRYRGQDWLINPGSMRDYQYAINPLRKFYGVNHWSGVFLAQSTSDASGGAALLWPDTPVTQWWSAPGKVQSRLIKGLHQATGATALTAGWKYSFDADFSVEVLAPETTALSKRAVDNALVLLFTWRGTRLLVAQQIGFGREQQVLAAHPDLRVDVLVQGVHPQEPNMTLAWLKALQPNNLVRAAPPSFQRRVFADEWEAFSAVPESTLWDQKLAPCVIVQFTDSKPHVTAWVP